MSREEFENASSFVRGIAGKLDSDQLLYFYARFKQAKEGPNETDKPGFLDFQGKKKWQAWKDLGDLSSNQARLEYVQRLDEIEPNWRDSETPMDKAWVSVSTMQAPGEEPLKDNEKTLFDWLKEGNEDKLISSISEQGNNVNELDGDGMGLIHWAADRGNDQMVKLLLQHGANVNLRDREGQTALHFAASCGHENVIKELLENKADKTICDNDGNTASMVAYNDKLKDLLK